MTRKTKVVLVSVGASALVAAVVLFVILPAIVDKARDDVAARIAAHYDRADIVLEDTLAQSYGLASKGATQVRGNGGLVLTRTTLHFFQMSPAAEVRIPLHRIVEARVVTSHLGKTAGRDLLAVRFRDASGTEDEIAWFVRPAPEAWRARLRELTAADAP